MIFSVSKRETRKEPQTQRLYEAYRVKGSLYFLPFRTNAALLGLEESPEKPSGAFRGRSEFAKRSSFSAKSQDKTKELRALSLSKYAQRKNCLVKTKAFTQAFSYGSLCYQKNLGQELQHHGKRRVFPRNWDLLTEAYRFNHYQ